MCPLGSCRSPWVCEEPGWASFIASPGLGLGGGREVGRSHPSPSWELSSQTGP